MNGAQPRKNNTEQLVSPNSRASCKAVHIESGADTEHFNPGAHTDTPPAAQVIPQHR